MPKRKRQRTARTPRRYRATAGVWISGRFWSARSPLPLFVTTLHWRPKEYHRLARKFVQMSENPRSATVARPPSVAAIYHSARLPLVVLFLSAGIWLVISSLFG